MDQSAAPRRQRTLVRLQPGVSRGRSSEVEHRSANPARPVRSGSSALTGRGWTAASAAALALITAATEERYEIVGFFAGKAGFKSGRSLFAGWIDGLTPLSISPRQRRDDAVAAASNLEFGGTDCALPML